MKKMIIQKKFIMTLIAFGAAAIFVMPKAGYGKDISLNSTWEIVETTKLSSLTIGKGAAIKTPKGKDLTMTVNGTETPVKPGVYNGDVVLTVTKENIKNFDGMGTKQAYHYRAAIDVENGKYVAEKSVAAAVTGGAVTDISAKDVKIISIGDAFNGIIVKGDSKSSYSIINPVISMTGNGINDFAGFGAAIMTDGKAEVTIENAKINNTGVVRTAIWVGGNSIAKINNSEIETHNGTMPKDYGWSWAKGGGGDSGDVMREVPWMLGIIGNNRTTTVVGSGRAYYNKTHIKAQAWGALSTDQVGEEAILYATNCHIEVVESGYGSFADGSVNTYSGCTFDVKDYGLIMQRGSAHFTDKCVINSGRLGVMTYSGSTKLTIDKGCVFNTDKAAIQVKSGNPAIIVDSAQLNSRSGVILQAMVNDDPNKSGPGAPGSAAGGPGGSQAAPGGQGNAPAGGSRSGASGDASAVNATFRNMSMKGDIINSMTAERDVVVNLEKATITGAITTATAVHAVGRNGEKLVMQDKNDLYYIIGEETDTYCSTDNKYGMKVSLDNNSNWVVDKTSYLTDLAIAEGGALTAPKGFKVTMTVDGAAKEIKAGTYKGKIVLIVIKS
jgi:hypothetical protein